MSENSHGLHGEIEPRINTDKHGLTIL